MTCLITVVWYSLEYSHSGGSGSRLRGHPKDPLTTRVLYGFQPLLVLRRDEVTKAIHKMLSITQLVTDTDLSYPMGT